MDADARAKSIGQQLQEVQQQLTDADGRVENLGQQLQDVQQRLVDADVQIRRVGQEIKSCEERLERSTQEQFSDITKIVDEHVLRRKNLQVAFGEIAGDISQLKSYLPRLTGEDEQIQNLHAMLRSCRRTQGVALAASIVSLLAVVYIGLDKPGWPIITNYLSSWLPG